MRYSGDSLLDLVPHRPPVLALSAVEWHGANEIEARMEVESGSPFFHAGRGIPFWSCLEFFGQAVAALEGLRARAGGRPPPSGYLLGSRRCVCAQEYFPAGTVLALRVAERGRASGDTAVFDARAEGGAHAFECAISVYKLGDRA